MKIKLAEYEKSKEKNHRSAQETSIPKDKVEQLISQTNNQNKTLKKETTENTIDELKKLTNIEEIKDFMDYTENCLKLIKKLKIPDEKLIEKMKIDLPDYMTKKKKLAIFDLDETLVHCEIQNPKQAEKIITIKLPNGGKAKVRIFNLLFLDWTKYSPTFYPVS